MLHDATIIAVIIIFILLTVLWQRSWPSVREHYRDLDTRGDIDCIQDATLAKCSYPGMGYF